MRMSKSRQRIRKLMKKCILCGKAFTEYGNNPWPVAHSGRCCDVCDANVVIPARMRLAGEMP
jgi:rRNA maturation endonuclease Nob1